jgi:hypothetical protein
VTTLVSCVMVAHDYEDFVGRAVDSVLGQTGFGPGEIELIVVDDGSTDGTPEVLAAYGDRIRLVRQENAGPAVAMTAGLELVRGEYVAFVDADDEWLPEHLAVAVEHLRAHPEVGLVHGDMVVVDADGEVLADSFFADAGLRTDEGRIFGRLLAGNQATTSSIVMRAELARAVPPPPAWAWCRDWWLAVHAAQHAEIGVIREPLVRYRRHGRNVNGLSDLSREKAVRLFQRDVRLRALLLRGLDLSAVAADELLQAVAMQLRQLQALDGAGVDLADVLDLGDAERVEAAAETQRARGLAAGDRLEALRVVMRAIAIDPLSPGPQELLDEIVNGRPAAASPSARTPASPVAPAAAGGSARATWRRFVAAVRAEELADDPALLAAWCQAFGTEPVTLRIVSLDDAAGAEQAVLGAMAQVGLDASDHRDLELLLCADEEHAAQEITRGAHVVLTRRRLNGKLDGMSATADVAVLRALAVKWWTR